jgi:gluconolactonase
VINALGTDGTVSLFMTNTGNTNGFAYDIDGSLILAQMGGAPGHVARRDLTGAVRVIDPAGSGLHTPDDVVVRSDGTIYFSDGDFCPIGTLLGYASNLPVYMIKPGTSTLVQLGTTSGPNGIELSPDEKILYVAGFGNGTISAFDVAADGTATKRPTPLVSGLTNPDSFCLDAAGNLYVGVSTGVQVLRPDGTKVKLIPITAPAGSCTTAGVTNCTFGGDDGKTLYITSWTIISKVEGMPIPGLDWIVGNKRAKCM